MKKSIVLAAVAGIASAAGAQTGSLTIVPSTTTLDWTVTSTYTLAIYGNADFGTHIGGGSVAINASGSGVGSIVDMVGSSAAWGGLGEDDLGYAGGGAYTGLIFGQIIFLPFITPDAASALGGGDVLLGNVVVTLDSSFIGSIDFTTASVGSTFVLEVFDENANPGANPPGESTQLFASDISFGSASINVVPAPSALGLLGLGGLVAGRRRR